MTPGRLSEIEAATHGHGSISLTSATVRELCALARAGLAADDLETVLTLFAVFKGRQTEDLHERADEVLAAYAATRRTS